MFVSKFISKQLNGFSCSDKLHQFCQLFPRYVNDGTFPPHGTTFLPSTMILFSNPGLKQMEAFYTQYYIHKCKGVHIELNVSGRCACCVISEMKTPSCVHSQKMLIMNLEFTSYLGFLQQEVPELQTVKVSVIEQVLWGGNVLWVSSEQTFTVSPNSLQKHKKSDLNVILLTLMRDVSITRTKGSTHSMFLL